jgi:hypothetical protein
MTIEGWPILIIESVVVCSSLVEGKLSALLKGQGYHRRMQGLDKAGIEMLRLIFARNALFKAVKIERQTRATTQPGIYS